MIGIAKEQALGGHFVQSLCFFRRKSAKPNCWVALFWPNTRRRRQWGVRGGVSPPGYGSAAPMEILGLLNAPASESWIYVDILELTCRSKSTEWRI